MKNEIFSRNILYWGEDFQNYLSKNKIFVFGLGGVGGFALEALARAGCENFTLIDFDTVSKSNINRQIIALHSTEGQKKTELFEKRLVDINPEIKIRIFDDFYDEDLNDAIFSEKPDFIADAIDSLRPKIKLIKYARENDFNIITSFGAGNRFDATKLKITDISEIQSNDTFVKNILSKLKKEEVKGPLPVVWSEEKAKSLEKIKNFEKITTKNGKTVEFIKFTPASTPVVPAVAGYFMANYILNCILEKFKILR